jgi:hypothetical protein
VRRIFVARLFDKQVTMRSDLPDPFAAVSFSRSKGLRHHPKEIARRADAQDYRHGIVLGDCDLSPMRHHFQAADFHLLCSP